jgi:prepilin-type N-terminal cleavage/methylation domain-containing protein
MRTALSNRNGFTLVEIIMVIVLLGIMGVITFQVVFSGVETFVRARDRKELYDQGRLALERMIREVRAASQIAYPAAGSSGTYLNFTRATYAYAAGAPLDTSLNITYQLNGTMLERVGSGSGTVDLASSVTNLTGFQVNREGASLDNVTDRYAAGTGVLAHTINSGSGNNRLLVVCYGQEGNSTITAMTYNGVPLTSIHREHNPDGAENVTEMWYMLDKDMPAASGTYNLALTVTGGNGPGIVVLSFTGVAQQAPEMYNASQYNDFGSDRSTTQLTNVTPGALIVSVACNGSSGGYDGSVGGAGGAGIRRSEGQPSSAGMGVSTDLSSAGGTFNVVEISELSPSTTLRATHIVAAFSRAEVVTLDLELSSTSAGTIPLRTKVYPRNVP